MTLSLIDFLPRLGPPTAEEASAWVAAALAEAAALRRYDDRLFPREEADLPVAQSIHHAWRAWVDEARSLLSELRTNGFDPSAVERFEEFRYAIDRTRAVLQITPERSLRGLQQARRGEGIEMAEAREHVARRRRALEEASR